MSSKPKTRPSVPPFLATLVLSLTALMWQTASHAQSAGTAAVQSSSQGGVTVQVTPRPAPPGAQAWEFGIVLDTHSQDLGDVLVGATVLVVDGNELKPVRWIGPAPGGHHREGTLTFPAPSGPVQAFELRLQRPGEPSPRIFRWDEAVAR